MSMSVDNFWWVILGTVIFQSIIVNNSTIVFMISLSKI